MFLYCSSSNGVCGGGRALGALQCGGCGGGTEQKSGDSAHQREEGGRLFRLRLDTE